MAGSALFERLASLLAAVGKPSFYERALDLLSSLLPYQRRLIVKYQRFAVPQFLLNQSLDEASLHQYLGGLYRLDPLLRLVSDGFVPKVTTFAAQRAHDKNSRFYDELYRLSGIFDEVVLFLRSPDGDFIGFCFDHSQRFISVREQSALRRIEPLLANAHRLHCQLLGNSLKAGVETALEDFSACYGLSRREHQLLEKTMQGYSTEGAAEKLGLSAGTVKNYKHHLYLKLDITSEREIFSLFMAHLLGHLSSAERHKNQ